MQIFLKSYTYLQSTFNYPFLYQLGSSSIFDSQDMASYME